MLVVVHDRIWIIGIVALVALPLSYVLNRAVASKFWASNNEREIPSCASTAVYTVGLWALIALVVSMGALFPSLWWLWLVLFLGLAYAGIAVFIIRRSHQRRS